MQTRKDLYQAHKFMQQRLGLALLQGEPDVPESPMRRYNVAAFCGALVSVLLLAGFGIWGLLSPGHATKLTDPGQLLVEEETGALFVYSQSERQLLPVANYVSARLLLDESEINVRNVTAASLAEFRRGPLVGITGAPDSLPAKEKLVKGPWSVCVVEGEDSTGGRRPYTSLIGGTDVGGTPVGDSAMVVNDGRQNWVLWSDRRMRVSATGVRALNAQPRRVPPAWLNAIPAGPDFAAPDVPNRGKRVRAGGRVTARVGQIFTVPGVAGSPDEWYVLLSDGLAQITLTQARLLLEDPVSKKAYGNKPVRPISIDDATANASRSARNIAGGGLPAVPPKIVNPPLSQPICAVYKNTRSGSTAATLTHGSTIGIPVPRKEGTAEHFDQVLLPPGGAVLAGLLPSEGQLNAINTYFLVTDQGYKHALASAEVISKLGYEQADVAPVPAHLLHPIPDGPALDPQAARSPIQIGR